MAEICFIVKDDGTEDKGCATLPIMQHFFQLAREALGLLHWQTLVTLGQIQLLAENKVVLILILGMEPKSGHLSRSFQSYGFPVKEQNERAH